jgi:hypothetical protein
LNIPAKRCVRLVAEYFPAPILAVADIDRDPVGSPGQFFVFHAVENPDFRD